MACSCRVIITSKGQRTTAFYDYVWLKENTNVFTVCVKTCPGFSKRRTTNPILIVSFGARLRCGSFRSGVVRVVELPVLAGPFQARTRAAPLLLGAVVRMVGQRPNHTLALCATGGFGWAISWPRLLQDNTVRCNLPRMAQGSNPFTCTYASIPVDKIEPCSVCLLVLLGRDPAYIVALIGSRYCSLHYRIRWIIAHVSIGIVLVLSSGHLIAARTSSVCA